MSKVVFIKTRIDFPFGTSRADMIARFQHLDVWSQETPLPLYSSPKMEHIMDGKKVKLVTKVGRKKVLLTSRVDRGEVDGYTWCRWQVNVE